MKLSFGAHGRGKLGIVQPNDKNDPAPIPLETCTKTRRDPAPDRRPMARARPRGALLKVAKGNDGNRDASRARHVEPDGR